MIENQNVKSHKRYRPRTEVDKLCKQVQEQGELKWWDLNSTGSFAGGQVNYFQLSEIPRGVGSNARIGDACKLKNISYSIHAGDTTATLITRVYRILLVQWFPNIATPGPTFSQIVTSGSAWSAPLNMNNRQSYKVLLDEAVYVITTTSKNYHIFRGTVHIDPKHSECLFQNFGSVAGTNKLFLIVCTGTAAASHDFSARTIVRFYDS